MNGEEYAATACALPFRTGRNRPRLAGLGLQQGGCGGLAARSGVLWSAVAGGRAWARTSTAHPDGAFFAMFEKILSSVRFR